VFAVKIYGKNVLYEAVNSNHKIYEVYLRDDVYKSDTSFLKKLNDRKIKVHVLDKHNMNQMFDGLNQGYGANIENFYDYSIEEIVKPDKKQLILILDKLNDPNNLGAIIRSCDAFSVDAIIIPKKNSVGITDTVVKISTGACFYVPIVTVSNINQAIEKLKKNNFWIIGTDASATQSIYDIKNDCNLA
jgi:23S rRNA (guanosine2251-2'-O)-methyltransferase